MFNPTLRRMLPSLLVACLLALGPQAAWADDEPPPAVPAAEGVIETPPDSVTTDAPTTPTNVTHVVQTTTVQREADLRGLVPGPGGQQVILSTIFDAYADW